MGTRTVQALVAIFPCRSVLVLIHAAVRLDEIGGLKQSLHKWIPADPGLDFWHVQA